jgi:SH3-like domain-containing protein
VRKGGFYGGLAALVLLVFALSFAVVSHRESIKSTQGIVTTPSASVKSSPDSAGKDLFLIYEGARVTVRDELNGWCEITIADGNRGWIKASTIEMI